jgi:hypothetical protein
MRVTSLFIQDSAATVSRLTAPIPDPEPLAFPTTLSAAARDPTEAAWDAFESATFPTLNRRQDRP